MAGYRKVHISSELYDKLAEISARESKSVSKVFSEMVEKVSADDIVKAIESKTYSRNGRHTITVSKETYSKVRDLRWEASKKIARRYSLITKLRRMKRRKTISLRDVADAIVLTALNDSNSSCYQESSS